MENMNARVKSGRGLPRSTAERRRDAAPLRVSSHEAFGKVGVLRLTGYLNGPGGSVLVQEAHRLLEKGCPVLLIDFAGTRLVNHHGLLALADLSRSFGPRLTFHNLSPTVARIFSIVGLPA